MGKVRGQYVLTKDGWAVRYKIEDGDEQHFEQVMLHPNNNKYANENQMGWFNIKDCPNLHNGGEWEPMAIVYNNDNIG
jgi:hypothetical protein